MNGTVVSKGLNGAAVTLNLSNLIVQSVGIRLLYLLYNNGVRGSQQVYLISLTLSQFLMNLLQLAKGLANILPFPPHLRWWVHLYQNYLMIALFQGLIPVFYLNMIFLTLDRLLTVAFSLKYSAVWDEKKVRKLLTAIWIIGAVSATTAATIYHEYTYKLDIIFFKCIFPILEISFPLLAALTYSKLFRKHRKSYRLSRLVRHCQARRRCAVRRRRKTTGFHVFWRSRFIVSVNIVLIFILLRLIPTSSFLFYVVIEGNTKYTNIVLTLCCITYSVHDLFNAFVYIFLASSVKSLMNEITARWLNKEKVASRYGVHNKTQTPNHQNIIESAFTIR